MKNIDLKIAKSEAAWRRYTYENIGVLKSAKLFFQALERSAKKRVNCFVKTTCAGMKRAVLESTYDESRKNIVVSLTTTENRIKNIFPTLYSLVVQTRKPDIIVLWLGKDVDYSEHIISRIKALGIEIEFREDVGPNTKYYYAFKEYKNDLVITVDDDIIYHEEMIEELYGTYMKYPNLVVARRVNMMRFDFKKRLLKYTDWIWEYRDSDAPSFDLLATGVGGVLYSPAIMALNCWENNDFLRVSPGCDDIWLKFCELSQGVKVCAVDNSRFSDDIINYRSQKTSLSSENVDNGKNDERIRSCIEYFGMRDDLCERVLSD